MIGEVDVVPGELVTVTPGGAVGPVYVTVAEDAAVLEPALLVTDPVGAVRVTVPLVGMTVTVYVPLPLSVTD